jgi:hypothetical protein
MEPTTLVIIEKGGEEVQKSYKECECEEEGDNKIVKISEKQNNPWASLQLLLCLMQEILFYETFLSFLPEGFQERLIKQHAD